MGDFVELYVSCNPPLLPKGVKHVLDELSESRIGCAEILYEPTVPWFQCTVTRRQYYPLRNFLTSHIHEILEKETGDFELDPEAGDIEIIGNDPMILSWGAFLHLKKEVLDEYEQYRYPEPFRSFPFKAIWQNLRSVEAPEALNTKILLQREGDFDWSIKAFMELVGCEVSFNIREDILYLGSNDSASIDRAARYLDLLFEYRKHAAQPPTQLVLPPSDLSEWQLCLRPISKFRLSTSTIIQTNAVTASDDYRNLYAKGVISTYVFDRYGEEWGLPECPLPIQTPLARAPFVDFANYSYPAKQATSRPSATILAEEGILPNTVSDRTAAIVADWVQKTGEARDLGDQTFQHSNLPPPDDGLLSPVTPQLDEQRSPAGTAPLREVHVTAVRNIIDEDEPHLDTWSLKNGSVQPEASRMLTPHKGLATNSSVSVREVEGSTGNWPMRSGGMGTALADLVGLSIPIPEEAGPSNTMVEHVATESHGHSAQLPTSMAPVNGQGSQRKSRCLTRPKDLLGMDDDSGLQDLIAPMVPISASLPGFETLTPTREYRHTMNQRAPRRQQDRAPRQPHANPRLSPSPPPSLSQRRSKIPIKSRAPPLDTRDAQLTATPEGASVAGGGAPGPTHNTTVPRGFRFKGSWITGLRGEGFGGFVLSTVLRDSVKSRSHFEHALEECLAAMLRKARIMTGKVSMEIVFCRIVIENVDEAVVNFGRVDEFHQPFMPVRFLNELALYKEDDFRWHGTLSLNGNDANRLKETNWISDAKKNWKQHDTAVFYDFGCEDIISNCRFIIQVNAADFTYDFESQKFALDDLVFIHCPDRSWDLNAYVKATDTAYFKDKYGEFADSLVESLAVPDGLRCGDPHFSFHESGQHRVSVERVRVRHVARYRDGVGGNSFLNITMWQATNMDWDAVEDNNRNTRHIRVEPSENDDTKGLANVWYEASISSARAENAFQENAVLGFGEEVKWTETGLKNEGVFKTLYRPAIAMVERMDEIGSGNDNGRNPFGGSVMEDAKTRIEDLKAGSFW